MQLKTFTEFQMGYTVLQLGNGWVIMVKLITIICWVKNSDELRTVKSM